MKLLVIADVHGNFEALAAVLAAFAEQVDQVLFLGDLVGYYGRASLCLDRLAALPMLAVRGNHDQVLIEAAAGPGVPADYEGRYGTALSRLSPQETGRLAQALAGWPLRQTIELAGRRLVMVHGTLDNPLEGRLYPDTPGTGGAESLDADLVLLGHTHYPLLREVGPVRIVNPGSVGQPRDRSDGACCALIDLVTMAVTHHRVPYDRSAVIEAARRDDPDHAYLVEVLQR